MPELSLTYVVHRPFIKPATGEKSPMLLLLHGVGSNEHDLIGLAPYFDERFFTVSARAPLARDNGNRGASFGWYPVEFTERGAIADESVAETSRERLEAFVGEAVAAYDLNADRVYIAGFSQGAIMTIYLSLHSPELVAGAVAMSGRLIGRAFEERASNERLAGLPICVVHGVYDNVLTIEDGRYIQAELSRLPVELSYQEFPMGHHTSPESIKRVSDFLTDCLDSPRRK